MIYKKTHTDRNAFITHRKAINERGGLAVATKKGDKYIVTYWFDKKVGFEPINVATFNRWAKKEIKSWVKQEYNGDLIKINNWVASQFLYKVAENIGSTPNEIYWKNESLKPTNHFQLVMDLEDVTIMATFVHVDNEHNVIADRTKIEIVDSEEYDTISIVTFK